jgi:hypothetical protein
MALVSLKVEAVLAKADLSSKPMAATDCRSGSKLRAIAGCCVELLFPAI